MYIRALIPVTLAVIFLSATAAPLEAFRFAVIGGTGPIKRDTLEYPPAVRSMLESINEMKPAFVVNLGDVINVSWNKDRIRLKDNITRALEAYFEQISLLKVPHYTVPGDDDIFDNISRKCFEEKTGSPLSKTFWCQDSLFIILDSEKNVSKNTAKIDSEQLTWLGEQLENGRKKARYIFVFIHRPLFTGEIKTNRPLESASIKELHQLFKNYKVTAVFSGHERILFSPPPAGTDGVRYFITSGGRGPYRKFQGEKDENLKAFNHYILVDVRNSGVSYRFIRFDEAGEFVETGELP